MSSVKVLPSSCMGTTPSTPSPSEPTTPETPNTNSSLASSSSSSEPRKASFSAIETDMSRKNSGDKKAHPSPSASKTQKKPPAQITKVELKAAPKKPEVKKTPPKANVEEKVSSEWKVNRSHLDYKIVEVCDVVPLSDVNSTQLLEILAATPIAEDSLLMWQTSMGYPLFKRKDQLTAPLTTVCNYCETSPLASPLMKNKLRYITYTLSKNKEVDKSGLLVLLAAHGNVCNVQKEVGVNMAYSLINDTVKSYIAKVSIDHIVYKELYHLREEIVEEVFLNAGVLVTNKKPGLPSNEKKVNTHHLVEFRNGLCSKIGLGAMPDPDKGCLGNITILPKHSTMFFESYDVKRIVAHVDKCLNVTPRKIPYDVIVSWFQDNSLSADTYEFLAEVFDEDTGLVKPMWIQYFLQKIKVLDGPKVTLPKPTEPVSGAGSDTKTVKPTEPVSGAGSDTKTVSKSVSGASETDALPSGPPGLTRQISNDKKMPKMVRQNSKDELEGVVKVADPSALPAQLSSLVRARLERYDDDMDDAQNSEVELD